MNQIQIAEAHDLLCEREHILKDLLPKVDDIDGLSTMGSLGLGEPIRLTFYKKKGTQRYNFIPEIKELVRERLMCEVYEIEEELSRRGVTVENEI